MAFIRWKDHFPIPCLNGNMIYLDAYFNRSLSEKRLLKHENVRSENILPALQLLKSKQQSERNWNLEKKISNMVASVGAENKPNEISRLWMKTKGIH